MIGGQAVANDLNLVTLFNAWETVLRSLKRTHPLLASYLYRAYPVCVKQAHHGGYIITLEFQEAFAFSRFCLPERIAVEEAISKMFSVGPCLVVGHVRETP